MPITGEGLRNVLIVSDKTWHSNHFMMERLMNRSGGLNRAYFFFADLYTPNLAEEIRKRDIKVILGCGEQVLNRLVGEKDILRWRGRVLDWDNRHFIPTFAPHRLLPENPNASSFLPGALQNPPRFQGTWMLDAEFALHVAKHGFTRKRATYIVDPTASEFDDWANDGFFKALAENPELKLSYDIETAYKQKNQNEDEFDQEEVADGTMLRISFSYEEYTGVSVTWSPQYFACIKALLQSDCIKVGWNCLGFDNPVLEKNGFPVNGMVYDGMDMFHFYQSDLPKGLEFVTSFTSDMLPWKHLNYSDPGLYSAIDPDAALRNVNWLEAKLKSTGQWNTFLNHYVRLMPAMIQAGKRGCFIDIAKRDELRTAVSAELKAKLEEIQPLVPLAVKPRKRYKREPFEPGFSINVVAGSDSLPRVPETLEQNGTLYEKVIITGKVKFCTHCGERDVKKTDHFKGGKKNPCKAAGATIELRDAPVVEWDEILDFNPNSGDQLKAYARNFGHPIGVDVRDSTKETMDAGHLKVLAKEFPDHRIYPLTLAYHKLSKTLGTYIYDPDGDGLIHTTYKNTPSTPRFCVARGTLVEVVRDVSQQPQATPIEQVRKGDLVYTYDDNLQLTVKPVLWAGKTGHRQIVRVHWEAGTGRQLYRGHVDVTPEHRIRLADGSYKEAQYLEPIGHRGNRRKSKGDRTLALHRSTSVWGYSLLFATGHREPLRDHRVVFTALNDGMNPKHVHHRNNNKLDNRPENLEGFESHAAHFGEEARQRRQDANQHLHDHLVSTDYPYPVEAAGYIPNNHRIVAIEWLGEPVDVYDIEVKDTHNFIANEICVHNSSVNENLQNVGKREDNIWATKAREQLVARPGHRYVQADSSAIEALVQGWWMGDVQYMELATQSVHAWVVAKMNGIPWDGSEEQVAYLKANFKNDYNKFKTANYLTNFGGGPYLMWKTAPETFPTQDDARKTQDMLYAMLPKLKEFHHWVRTKAQKEGYLELPGWRARHYFYDVFTTDGVTGKVKYGRDAKRVCAFFPQGCAAAFMRDNMLLLAYGDKAAEWLNIEPLGLGDGYLSWMPANVVVHDGYTLEVPDGKEEEAAEILERVLTRPIPQLANLRVGCEVDIGPVGGNWSPSHPEKNPKGLVTVKTVRVPVVPPPMGHRIAA